MTAPALVNNTVESGANVGVQAGEIHNTTNYSVSWDSDPATKYEVGLRYLTNGEPSHARKWIGEAIAHGYDSSEVRFHWVLAILSKRSLRELSAEQREQLHRLPQQVWGNVNDEWKRALDVIYVLLTSLNDPVLDTTVAVKELDTIPKQQRELISQHLSLVLSGGMMQAFWKDARDAALDGQVGDARVKRVWAYFERSPASARVRQPDKPAYTYAERARAVACSAAAGLAYGVLAWLALRDAQPLPVLALLFTLAAGYVGVRNGAHWYCLTAQRRVKERIFAGRARGGRPPEGGFADQVDHSFRHFFHTYLPRGTDRKLWLSETAGIHNTLRNEVVDLYREQRVGLSRVEWLIRHMVSDMRTRWERGTMFEYRQRYTASPSTKLWCVVPLTLLAPALLFVIVTAIRTEPLLAVPATLFASLSSRFAVMDWIHIRSERRRHIEEIAEAEQTLAQRTTARQRWKDKLDATRPDEQQMQRWLDCDLTLLLDSALRHYRLSWEDVLTHGFLTAPADKCNKARVPHGSWRYSKYEIQLYIITHDGVREVHTMLDFENAEWHDKKRNNFRFDAVSSVQVAKGKRSADTLQLTLTNGPSRAIRVDADSTEPEHEPDPPPDEDPEALARHTLDTSGFTHTLHILEGIAAEGKEWIKRDRRS